MRFELVITNSAVIDGTGSPPLPGWLGHPQRKNHRGWHWRAPDRPHTCDATGLVVASSFVDVHSHPDWIQLLPDRCQALAILLRLDIPPTGVFDFEGTTSARSAALWLLAHWLPSDIYPTVVLDDEETEL